jgi:hypothetical protein
MPLVCLLGLVPKLVEFGVGANALNDRLRGRNERGHIEFAVGLDPSFCVVGQVGDWRRPTKPIPPESGVYPGSDPLTRDLAEWATPAAAPIRRRRFADPGAVVDNARFGNGKCPSTRWLINLPAQRCMSHTPRINRFI